LKTFYVKGVEKLFLLFILPSCLYSQDKFVVDSLLLEYKQVESDTSKVCLLCDLSFQFQKGDFLKALEYSDKALDLDRKSGNKRFIALVPKVKPKGGA